MFSQVTEQQQFIFLCVYLFDTASFRGGLAFILALVDFIVLGLIVWRSSFESLFVAIFHALILTFWLL